MYHFPVDDSPAYCFKPQLFIVPKDGFLFIHLHGSRNGDIPAYIKLNGKTLTVAKAASNSFHSSLDGFFPVKKNDVIEICSYTTGSTSYYNNPDYKIDGVYGVNNMTLVPYK